MWDAFFSTVCLCAGGIIAFSPLLIRLLAAESYYDAWRYIPILTLSMIAAAFSNFMGSVYVVTKKSTASLWISLAGAQTVFQRKQVVSMILTAFHGFCMALADSAPGVSGGTIAFIPFIAAAERTALKRLRGALFALLGMAVVVGLTLLRGSSALGSGVLAGVALSIHAIRTALHKYRSEMVWLILGLMLGSLYAIVYGAVNLTVPLPPMSLVTFDAPAPLLAGQQRAAAHR